MAENQHENKAERKKKLSAQLGERSKAFEEMKETIGKLEASINTFGAMNERVSKLELATSMHNDMMEKIVKAVHAMGEDLEKILNWSMHADEMLVDGLGTDEMKTRLAEERARRANEPPAENPAGIPNEMLPTIFETNAETGERTQVPNERLRLVRDLPPDATPIETHIE